MARGVPQRTIYPGVLVRELADGTRVHDVKFPGPPGKGPITMRGVRNADGSYANLREARKLRGTWAEEARQGRTPGAVTAARAAAKGDGTVAAFAEQVWLPQLQARRNGMGRKLAPGTERNYRTDYRNHVAEQFGDWQLTAITVDDVEAFGAHLLTLPGRGPSGTLSGSSALRIVNTLGYVLALAKKKNRDTGLTYNPVEDAEKPSAEERKVKLPTLAELEALDRWAPDDSTARLVRLAWITGLRIGELFALRTSSVDVAAGTLVVSGHVYDGQPLDGAKSRAGEREVALGPTASGLLGRQLAWLQEEGVPNAHGLVWPSPAGTYWRASNFHRRVWAPMRAQAARDHASLGRLYFHDLRRIARSHLDAQGVAEAILEQQLGHSDTGTGRSYSRPTEASAAVLRLAQEAAFGGVQ